MAFGVVRGFEPIDVDIRRDELAIDALDAIDLSGDGSQSGAAAADPGQLVGPGVFTVLGCLRAILRRDLAVKAALCPIVRRNLAIVDGSHTAVRGIGALRSGPGARVLGAPAVAGRAIPGGSVEITGSVVTGFGLLVAQPGREVAVTRSQPGLPTTHRRQLVRPGILAVLRGLLAILGCDFPVVDGAFAAVGSLGAPRVGPGTFVRGAPSVARRAVPRGSVAIAGRVVTRFGLSIAQAGRDVTVPGSEPSLPAAHRRQLVGPGILTISRRLSAIVRRNLAVVDRPHAAVRGIGAP